MKKNEKFVLSLAHKLLIPSWSHSENPGLGSANWMKGIDPKSLKSRKPSVDSPGKG